MILANFISTVHFLKFSNFVQTLIQMKILSISLDIKLHVMSTSQLFWKKVHLTTKYHCGMETWHWWIFMFGIVISETNYSNKEKGKNPTLQELRKNSYIFIDQECVLRVSNSEKIATLLTHNSTIVYVYWRPTPQSCMASGYFEEINMNFEDLISKIISVCLVDSCETFAKANPFFPVANR